MEPLIVSRIDGPIGYITLNRENKLNALTEPMLEQLEDITRNFDANHDIRVVIIQASGKAFCVGADINAWSKYSALDFWRHWVKRGHEVFDRVAALRQPVIAAIQGRALGGGLELALAADLRVATQSTQFGLPETGIGAVPGWSGSQRLNQLLNPSIIKELVFTGQLFDSERALQLGLINNICAEDELLNRTTALALEIAERAPVAVQLAKQVIDAGRGNRLAMVLEGVASGLVASTEDAQEGKKSFQEKRKPYFNGY